MPGTIRCCFWLSADIAALPTIAVVTGDRANPGTATTWILMPNDLAELTEALDLKGAIHVDTQLAAERWLATLAATERSALPRPYSSALCRR